ncbi:peptidase M36 [Auriscalpium vulgare]|uniref:Peptidase M36 n=1 Tax=Auriscalpium vulgare TaxID=40419 RepID=A0ACB8R5T1_9AGAM|nr:peptidase M36 [Auriscalpium vulgare]
MPRMFICLHNVKTIMVTHVIAGRAYSMLDTGTHSKSHHSLTASDPLSVNVRKTSTYSNYTTTFGNNVFAHENWEGQSSWLHNYRHDGGKGLEFDYTYDPKPTNRTDSLDEAKKYINATVTQLFYTTNLIHDLYYRDGFDEVSGNFQQHNFGRGARRQRVQHHQLHDAARRAERALLNVPLEHGEPLSRHTRLPGGPANSGCLSWGESGGMGEGWGDFLATTIRSNSTYSDFPMGAWAANQVDGIRNFPYSLNETINPSTYKTHDKGGYWGVHAIGEVWAQTLWVIAQRLIAKHSFVEDLFPPAPLADGSPLVLKHVNSLIVYLVLNGIKLQSCHPSFFDLRDAIIQADEILTGGENYCNLWLAFAEKGLVQDAIQVLSGPEGLVLPQRLMVNGAHEVTLTTNGGIKTTIAKQLPGRLARTDVNSVQERRRTGRFSTPLRLGSLAGDT